MMSFIIWLLIGAANTFLMLWAHKEYNNEKSWSFYTECNVTRFVAGLMVLMGPISLVGWLSAGIILFMNSLMDEG